MKISKQARREAKALFLSCRANGLLDDDRVRRAVQEVIAAKPRGYVAILSHFQRLVKLDLDRRTARVESAVALSPAQQSELVNSLAPRYGHGLNISFSQNPTLPGDLRIHVASAGYAGTCPAR